MTSAVALVTGVSSSLGKAIVRRLAFAGYKVAAADGCASSVNEVTADNKKVGGDVVGFSVDIRDSNQRNKLISKVTEVLGSLDSLIIVPPDNDVHGDIMNTNTMQFDKLFNDRLTIPFKLTQAALPTLKKSKLQLNSCFSFSWNGSVVYLTSCTGYSPGLDLGLFSVVSTSVLSLTKNVSLSAARSGVRVNAVCLGMVDGDGSGAFWDSKKSDEAMHQLQSMIPLGRLGKPSDAASLVQFLISSRARPALIRS